MCKLPTKHSQQSTKKETIYHDFFLGSATRTRTGVYGVRGRCPRPLDDSTKVFIILLSRRTRCFSKAGTKVLLFFDIHKFCRTFFALFLRFFSFMPFAGVCLWVSFFIGNFARRLKYV